MIEITKTAVGDTRTCDYTQVTEDQLLAASKQHIHDVHRALAFFTSRIMHAATIHDLDKISDIAGFHRDFVTGFAQTEWWDAHRKLNRHHLNAEDGIPEDVNLIDVLDYVADCVMAALGRKGEITFPIELPGALLERALENTVKLLASQVVVRG